MDPRLQRAPRLASLDRCAGVRHAARNPCFTLREDNGERTLLNQPAVPALKQPNVLQR